jgi:hypothetical protein
LNKSNRKYLAANCLILAAKINDVKHEDISKLIDEIIDTFRFDHKRDVVAYEFAVIVALEFNLNINYDNKFSNHYDRLLTNSDYSKSIQDQCKNVSGYS